MSLAFKARPGVVHGLNVVGRVALAAGGGYGLAALATGLLSLTLPLARSEAVTVATLLSFPIIIAVTIVVFTARSVARAAIGMAVLGSLLGGVLWSASGLIQGGSPK
jgi:hypothetical protein